MNYFNINNKFKFQKFLELSFGYCFFIVLLDFFLSLQLSVNHAVFTILKEFFCSLISPLQVWSLSLGC